MVDSAVHDELDRLIHERIRLGIVAALAANESLKAPETLASFAKLGIAPKSSSPREFAAFLAAEARKWPPILKASGVKPE